LIYRYSADDAYTAAHAHSYWSCNKTAIRVLTLGTQTTA